MCAWTRRRRDRLQAAHARVVVLIESPSDGGAWHTVRAARALGRAVFSPQDETLPRQVIAAAKRIHVLLL